MDKEFVTRTAVLHGLVPLALQSRSILRFRFPDDLGYMKFGGLTPTHVFKFELVVEKTSFGRMIVIFNEHGEQTFRKSCSPDELQDVLSPLRVQYVHNL